jgi:hypothetical protein
VALDATRKWVLQHPIIQRARMFTRARRIGARSRERVRAAPRVGASEEMKTSTADASQRGKIQMRPRGRAAYNKSPACMCAARTSAPGGGDA